MSSARAVTLCRSILCNGSRDDSKHLVRREFPRAFRRNYALRSFGYATREAVETYVASQLGHHGMADDRVQERLARWQIVNPAVDLAAARKTSHGLFWHNLYVVLVHRERGAEVQEEVLAQVHDMIIRMSQKKQILVSRAAILADHIHLSIGCPFELAPMDAALAYLNNLAYVQQMRPVYQFGAYVGTFGKYDWGAVEMERPRRESDGA